MSMRLTKDEKNDLINEAMKSSVRFNAELQCDVIDGGGSSAPQGYYARFANDKDKIVKAAKINISRLKPGDNIENILIGKDIIAAIKNDSSFKILERQFVSGHLSIDVSTPITSLKFSDEIASYVGNSKALNHLANRYDERQMCV